MHVTIKISKWSLPISVTVSVILAVFLWANDVPWGAIADAAGVPDVHSVLVVVV